MDRSVASQWIVQENWKSHDVKSKKLSGNRDVQRATPFCPLATTRTGISPAMQSSRNAVAAPLQVRCEQLESGKRPPMKLLVVAHAT
jgi:hypothetical protein